MIGPVTLPTTARVLVWTGWIPDANRPSGRLRAARQILAESPWAPGTLDRDPAGVPRVRGFAPADTALTVPPQGQVSMSWSQSADEFAVAIADVGPVGIDLELVTGRTPPGRELALVLRHARVRLRPAPGCDAWCEWTAVEALVKAARCGLVGLITGRLLVLGRDASAGDDPRRSSNGTILGHESRTAPITVSTRHTGGAQVQRWQVHHQHNESRRLTVVIPD